MTGILDYQANVLLLCKLDPGRYIGSVGNVDRVVRNVAVYTACVGSERAARVVEPVRILNGRRVLPTTAVLAKGSKRSEHDTYCGSGLVQVAWIFSHSASSYKAP